MQQAKQAISYITLSIVGIALFVFGFWFGYKYDTNTESSDDAIQAVMGTTLSEPIEQVEVKTLELEGVKFILPGEEPICDGDYTIKGKYKDNIGVYYTTENKSYDGVKAFMCFATEDFANEYGFIKRF